MTDEYEFWRRALAGEEVGSSTLPVHEDSPCPGFYRKRTGRAAGYEPVAIWRAEGHLVALLAGREVNPCDIWSYCATHPVSEQHYRDFMATGQWWDGDSAVIASLQPPPAGHNQPPTDPAEVLKEQIDSALKGVGGYAEVKDDATAAKAQSLRSRLLELSRTADKERDRAVRPHLDAQKATNEIWMPLVKTAKAGADTIAKALGVHETRKAREDAARRAAETEEAHQVALKHGPLGAESEVPAPAPAPPAPKIAGSYGRAASVKVVKVATIADQDAFYTAVRGFGEVQEFLSAFAQKLVNNGHTPAGVTVEEERRVS